MLFAMANSQTEARPEK